MISKPSPLKLDQFYITKAHIEFSDPPETDEVSIDDIQILIDSYTVDIDFAIRRNKSAINIFVKADINNDELNAKPGYKISSECIGVFLFLEELPEDDIKRLINTSALVMTLNYLRAYISGVTSPMPWNKYFIPSIDMQDLHAKKSALIKKAREEQSEKTKKRDK
jgi:preprotein translocase subunit SecB